MPGKELLEKYMLAFVPGKQQLIVAKYVDGKGPEPITVIVGEEADLLYKKLINKEPTK